MSNRKIILGKDDGPMKFCHLMFIQVILGAAYRGTSSENERIKTLCKDFLSNAISENHGEHSKEFAEFVQAILNNIVNDKLAKDFLRDARVIIDPSSKYTYDYELNVETVEQIYKQNVDQISIDACGAYELMIQLKK